MPVSSPDQIWQGDRILNFVLISSSRLNQFDITVGLAPLHGQSTSFLLFVVLSLGGILRNPLTIYALLDYFCYR